MVRIIGDMVDDWQYLDERIERVLDDTPIASAIAGCAILLSRSSTI
jgi:hypothetical protein